MAEKSIGLVAAIVLLALFTATVYAQEIDIQVPVQFNTTQITNPGAPHEIQTNAICALTFYLDSQDNSNYVFLCPQPVGRKIEMDLTVPNSFIGNGTIQVLVNFFGFPGPYDPLDSVDGTTADCTLKGEGMGVFNKYQISCPLPGGAVIAFQFGPQ